MHTHALGEPDRSVNRKAVQETGNSTPRITSLRVSTRSVVSATRSLGARRRRNSSSTRAGRVQGSEQETYEWNQKATIS